MPLPPPGQRSSGGREADGLLARGLRDEVAGLRTLLPELARFAALGRDLRMLDRTVAALGDRCEVATAAAAGWPARVAEHEAALVAAQEAAARLSGLEDQADAARAALRAAEAAEGLQDELERARQEAARRREQWVDAREHWVTLRGQRLDGMAAELAAGLADGADCPVCGATEHPRPAEHDGPVVTAADEQAAREIVESDRGRERGGRRGGGDVRSASSRSSGASAGTGRSTSSGRTPSSGTRPSRRPPRRRPRVPAARFALDALLAARDSAAAALATDREELQARTAERWPCARTCPADRAADGGPRGRRGPAGADRPADRPRPSGARPWSPAGDRGGPCPGRRRTLRAWRPSSAPSQAGFDDVLEAAAALLDPGGWRALDRQIEEHDRALSVAQAALADADLADLPPRPIWRHWGAVRRGDPAARRRGRRTRPRQRCPVASTRWRARSPPGRSSSTSGAPSSTR